MPDGCQSVVRRPREFGLLDPEGFRPREKGSESSRKSGEKITVEIWIDREICYDRFEMKLPHAEQAIVDIAKLRDYCLNPLHPWPTKCLRTTSTGHSFPSRSMKHLQ